jgi:hypothetical protein
MIAGQAYPLLVFLFPAYLLAVGVVLRLLGNSKKDVAEWARKQAGRQRFTDLVRAWRGLPDEKTDEDKKPDELPGAAPTPERDDDSAAA